MFKWIWKNLDWIANLIEHSLVFFMYGWIYLCMGWVLPGHFLIFQYAFWFPVAVNRGTQGKTRDCILWINGGIVHLATGGIWVHCSLILYLLIHFFSIQFYVDYLGCVLKTSQGCSRACAASENCSAWKYIHLKSTYAVSDYSRKWGRWFWMLPEVTKIL